MLYYRYELIVEYKFTKNYGPWRIISDVLRRQKPESKKPWENLLNFSGSDIWIILWNFPSERIGTVWAYRYSSNDLEAHRVWIGQAGQNEKIIAVPNWPGGMPPKTPAEGESAYVRQYVCTRASMFQWVYNVLQSAIVCRERKYASQHS